MSCFSILSWITTVVGIYWHFSVNLKIICQRKWQNFILRKWFWQSTHCMKWNMCTGIIWWLIKLFSITGSREFNTRFLAILPFFSLQNDGSVLTNLPSLLGMWSLTMFYWMSLVMWDWLILVRVWNYPKMELWVVLIVAVISVNVCHWSFTSVWTLSASFVGSISCCCRHTRLYITRDPPGVLTLLINELKWTKLVVA